ncbi:fungal hydrophobin-domain-containing protein [Cyathus striatus]|nr:fungal hydrophobin-domain-containing protein [Cyathus striatus]
MKIKSVVFSSLTFATLAAAWGNPIPASQCTTGDLQCCQNSGSSTDSAISSALSLLGIVVQDVNALIGVTCSPISVIGAGGNSCTAQPVCCTDNSFNGLIALGCTPINLYL